MSYRDPEALRRRIRLYREYLAEGVEAETAVEYLKTIAEDEAALREIDGGAEKRR
jgi:hypothetical protein